MAALLSPVMSVHLSEIEVTTSYVWIGQGSRSAFYKQDAQMNSEQMDTQTGKQADRCAGRQTKTQTDDE